MDINIQSIQSKLDPDLVTWNQYRIIRVVGTTFWLFVILTLWPFIDGPGTYFDNWLRHLGIAAVTSLIWVLAVPRNSAIRYRLKSKSSEFVRDKLELVGYTLVEERQKDRMIFLKKTGWLKFRVAMIHEKQDKTILEIGEQYNDMLGEAIEYRI